MLRSTSRRSFVGRCPNTRTSPSVGSSSPQIMFTVVVLPEPLGPSRQKTPWLGICSDRSWTATKGSLRLLPNLTQTRSSSIARSSRWARPLFVSGTVAAVDMAFPPGGFGCSARFVPYGRGEEELHVALGDAVTELAFGRARLRVQIDETRVGQWSQQFPHEMFDREVLAQQT